LYHAAQPGAMALTTLDGRDFRRFVAAGTFFLRKYRGVLNDLNVFPVPDGDTGSNMYLTARAALREAASLPRTESLPAVAAALARGSLLGARGNSGVILSQMLRGFAHAVRHRAGIDALQAAIALKDAVAAARSALTNPVEGTVITVAQAAADEAYRLALKETDLLRVLGGVVRAANAALERTPEQLPALKEAGVVDSGGAGFCYFIEGALLFLPESTVRATAFPRRPLRSAVFTRRQAVGENRFCTEFVLESATLEASALRDLLTPLGDSLIVAGGAPTLKVHVHSGRPEAVQAAAGGHGTVTRLKVEDMARQHQLLVVEAPAQAFAVAAVVPGPGFEQIARELGADVTIPVPRGSNPSVQDLLVGVNAALSPHVVLLANDPNVALAAREVAGLTTKKVTVVPSRDVVHGLAVLLALADRAAGPDAAAIDAALGSVASAAVFFAGKTTNVAGTAVRAGAPAATIDGRLLTAPDLGELLRETVRDLAAGEPGLATLYFGGKQKERDAQRFAETTEAHVSGVSVEWYFGGQADMEYWISFER
jgi:DAK2 domain fusion protein YloV